MNCEQKQELLRTYRDGILNDTVPFWFPRSVDREHDGYLHCLGRYRRSSQAGKNGCHFMMCRIAFIERLTA